MHEDKVDKRALMERYPKTGSALLLTANRIYYIHVPTL